MKTWIILAAMLVILPIAQTVSAETVPSWIKNNADWWAQGQIGDDVFVQGIQYLVAEDIISVPPTQVTQQASENIPDWVKNTAGWWAEGSTEDTDFLNGVQHLVKTGVITIGNEISQENTVETSSVQDIDSEANPNDSELTKLQSELDACQEITKAAKRSDCEKAAKHAINVHQYKQNTKPIQVGSVNFYWQGLGSEGNGFEISPTGQAILTVRMLAENTSSENISLQCTSPQICNYDVWNGDTAFKYSGMDFTNGQIVIKPGMFREFNMLFGPNIGYGGTQFVYDSAKDYSFRISEDWGSVQIPLDLG